MKLALSLLVILSLLTLYISFSSTGKEVSKANLSPEDQEVISSQEVAIDTKEIPLEENQSPTIKQIYKPEENIETNISEIEEQTGIGKVPEQIQPPIEDIHFSLTLNESTHHMIQGGAKADIGDIEFNSKLLPSNEVELSIILKQDEKDGIELSAYFDLANFTMELDGKNSVLNKDHKKILNMASSQLQSAFGTQYEGYEYPEHALMLTQMLAYWSISPEGYVHEKRSIVSQ